MEIRLYSPDRKSEWDSFVKDSKNGTFLLQRDFIEYHGNKFNDYSLMFFSDEELIAVMPGHISDKIYYSHQGLTYGGLIMNSRTTAVDVMNIFEKLTVTFRHQGIKKIIYKAVPHIYHRLPAEEDLYALFRHKAILSERNISSAILLTEKLAYSDSRKNGLKKAAKNNLRVEKSMNFASFWQILSNNLKERYNKYPVHSLDEIVYLKDKFSNEIQLYSVLDVNNEIVGGCVVFETENVTHVQYTAATLEGKSMGSVDLLIDYIINEAYSGKRYFDYGTSTENDGQYLNESLIYQKEGFGARAIIYDTYTIEL
ncbi:MAG: GNAT family N-acetyltransferase [Prevotella sp.]|nr:GNAT family N-acetyltransferase [Prevotella sp.]